MCTVGIFCGLSFSYILMTHATAPRSARTLAQARPTMSCIHLVLNGYLILKCYLIGASLSEPHIDEFAVNFLYIYIYIYVSVVRRAVSHFRLLFCAFLLRHALFQKRLEPRVVFSEGTNNSHMDGWTAR